MQIKIVEHHIHLSDEQRSLIEEKVAHLASKAHRAEDESAEIKIELEHQETRSQADAHTCKLTFFVPGKTLRSESHGESMLSALDQAIDKMDPQIERYKDKTHHISDRSK